jgi:hypothetical protein
MHMHLTTHTTRNANALNNTHHKACTCLVWVIFCSPLQGKCHTWALGARYELLYLLKCHVARIDAVHLRLYRDWMVCEPFIYSHACDCARHAPTTTPCAYTFCRCMYACMYVCQYMYILHTYVHTYIYVYTHKYMCVHVCMHICVCMCVYVRISACACMHADTLRIYTFTRVYVAQSRVKSAHNIIWWSLHKQTSINVPTIVHIHTLATLKTRQALTSSRISPGSTIPLACAANSSQTMQISAKYAQEFF